MINLDDVRNHTEVGTGYTKDAMLNLCADEIEKLRATVTSMQGDSEPIYQIYINGAWIDVDYQNFKSYPKEKQRTVFTHGRVKGVSDERAEFEKEFNPSPDIYLDDKTGCYLAKNSHHVVMAADKQRHWEGWQARSQLSTNTDEKAEAIYEKTKVTMGFVNAPPFNELNEQTKQIYRDKAISQEKGE